MKFLVNAGLIAVLCATVTSTKTDRSQSPGSVTSSKHDGSQSPRSGRSRSRDRSEDRDRSRIPANVGSRKMASRKSSPMRPKTPDAPYLGPTKAPKDAFDFDDWVLE